jgi:hypothetical protein
LESAKHLKIENQNDYRARIKSQAGKSVKAYYKDSNNIFEEWVAGGYKGKPRENIPYPEFCRDMKCEAKTRTGHPCKNDGTSWANGRCKYHGGASTGPVTPEDKKRASMNSSRQTPCEPV